MNREEEIKRQLAYLERARECHYLSLRKGVNVVVIEQLGNISRKKQNLQNELIEIKHAKQWKMEQNKYQLNENQNSTYDFKINYRFL